MTSQAPSSLASVPDSDNLAIGFRKEIVLDNKSRQLIESYCKLPSDQVIPHLYAVRDKAWRIFPWPCVGMWAFVVPTVNAHPQYSKILSLVKDSRHTILDLGCALGQDVRQLIMDGAPETLVYGAELESGFINLGYDLFLDRDRIQSQFIAADILEKSGVNAELALLNGKMDIIYTGRFLHCFGVEDGLLAAVRMVKLLRDRPGAAIVGECMGGKTDREVSAPVGKLHLYSVESFRELWAQAAEKSGAKFEVDVTAEPAQAAQMAHFGEDVVSLVFWIQRT